MENNLRNICNLINDSCTDRVQLFTDRENLRKTDDAVRRGFFEILGEDRLTWRGWRNHKNEIFTVMEDVLNTNLPLALEGSEFRESFVEVKNGALGDKNEFFVEDNSVLVAASFSGNHWDTDRKKLVGRKAFSVNTEWLYVRVYDDLERFLKGMITLEAMISRMQKAMNRAIDDRIFSAFNSAGTYLPAQFVKTGSYDRAAMTELIERVQAASGRNVVLAGTKTALSAVAEGINASWISEEQKREMASTGMLLSLTGLGVTAVEIPQAFIKGTYDFKTDNKLILVLPDNEKFIKIFFEGDTRARDLGIDDTHDQTVDTQIQTKVGVGVVFSSLFGKYKLV